jgi:hypothetical protein
MVYLTVAIIVVFAAVVLIVLRNILDRVGGLERRTSDDRKEIDRLNRNQEIRRQDGKPVRQASESRRMELDHL